MHKEHALPAVSAVGHRPNNVIPGATLILGLSVSFHFTVKMTRRILRRRFRALVGGCISGNWEMSHYHFNAGLLLEL